MSFPFAKIKGNIQSQLNTTHQLQGVMELIDKADKVFRENFAATASFERAIFFSWYCSIRDCAYCYMSTQTGSKMARRTVESLMAEALICKEFGWSFCFLSGGKDAYTKVEFLELLKQLHQAYGSKFYVNIGALTKEDIEQMRPFIEGVVAAVETINPKLHEKVCPSKPLAPFEDMFSHAQGLKKAITIIIGLGETIDDFFLLEEFIRKHGLDKIHIYSLNPQKGTVYEKVKPPKKEYHAEWIARTRLAFPKIDIQAGIWLDRADTVSLLLKAGANSVSKFPAIKRFNSEEAREIERQTKLAGRSFVGTLTMYHEPDTEKLLSGIDPSKRELVRKKLDSYLKNMRKEKS